MTIDSIDRLRVIAAGLTDSTLVEAVLDAPYDAVWALASDLEHGVPLFEPAVEWVQVVERRGDRLRVAVLTRQGTPLSIQVLLRDGYCLMQSELVAIGMAARAEAEKTRFAHFEHLPGRPAPERAKLLAELRAIERLARNRGE